MNQSLIIYIYTLSLHDALPILHCTLADVGRSRTRPSLAMSPPSLPPISTTASTIPPPITDRKSTRLNSSHVAISYAVFCLKKKNYLNKKKRTATPLVVLLNSTP